MRYFCGTSDTSNTTNSSVSSRTGASVTRLSSYLMKSKCFKAFLTNISREEVGGISPMLLLFFFYRCFVKRGRGTTFSLICIVELDAAPNRTADLFDTLSFTYGGITKERNPQRLFFVQDFCLRHISY